MGLGDKQIWNQLRQCCSLANKTAILYGEITFKNAINVISQTENNPDILIERLAAMVVQAPQVAKHFFDEK